MLAHPKRTIPWALAKEAGRNRSLGTVVASARIQLELPLLVLRKRPCSTEKTEVDTKLTADTYGMRQWTGTSAKETKEAGTQMSQFALSVASA